jgi:BMFP domain-containing protein YqiC
MASDLLSTLKSYITKVADGERTPAELAASINTWIKESTESIKLKVEDEVQRSVSKMGFIKRAEFDQLKGELVKLRNEVESARQGDTSVVPAKKQKAPTKKVATEAKAKKPVKSPANASTAKKAAPKKKVAKIKAKGE